MEVEARASLLLLLPKLLTGPTDDLTEFFMYTFTQPINTFNIKR